MDRPRRVVVGSDGSATAARAVRVASRIALALDVHLVVVTVWRPDPDERRSAESGPPDRAWHGEERWAQQVVADAAEVARHAGVTDVRMATPAGDAAQGLLDVSREEPGTLVVVGSVGLDSEGERRLGSIPHHLTHHAPGDLLLVREGAEQPHGWSEVVLTTDGSETSVIAARVGLALARRLDTTPVLVSAGRDRDVLAAVLRDVAARIDDGERLELLPAVGEDVADTLAAVAAERGLLVVGNRRMRGLGRLRESVPNAMTHRVPTDVLLVDTSS
jgi:nucleotide-binding universal stress UspA family protein